jgi:hypothetical protein
MAIKSILSVRHGESTFNAAVVSLTRAPQTTAGLFSQDFPTLAFGRLPDIWWHQLEG